MTDQVLVKNDETGSYEIKTLSYMLPLYDIGTKLIYKLGKSESEFESVVEGITTEVNTVDGQVIWLHIYKMSNDDDVYESEVTHFYPDGSQIDDDVEEIDISKHIIDISSTAGKTDL